MDFADVRVLEYGGLDRASPLDVTHSAAGNASTATSGAATTNFATELLLGAGTTATAFNKAGTNYTKRIITAPDGDIAEDRTVTATGSYSASAPVTGRGNWVMQMVAFKAAGQ